MPEPTTEKRRILIVDDHPMVRRGIAGVINDSGHLEVCGEADDANSAMVLTEKLQPELVIMDLSLAGKSGLEALKDLRARFPEVKTIVLSMHRESLFAERALKAGARGYLTKDISNQELLAALDTTLRGDIYLSDKVKNRIVKRFAGDTDTDARDPLEALSDREMEVLRLIGNGFRTKEMAQRLNLSPKTIDSYRDHLKDKLKLESGADLVRYAVQWVKSEATL